jgi:RimJ/RimL family protein N-acetyltransferase
VTRIETERLLLRPWTPDDAPALQRIASARQIADGLVSLPHPYPEGGAADWIAAVVAEGRERFAIFLRNLASGRVLQKAGMRREGTRRRHTFKDGEFLDTDVYALVRSEYETDAR